MTRTPPIHIIHTIGDPTGIGPEITAKYLSQTSIAGHSTPFSLTIIGHIGKLQEAAEQLNIPLPPESGDLRYIAMESPKGSCPPKSPGNIAYHSLVRAVEQIHRLQKEAPSIQLALVTGPINKANLHQAGHQYAGHTEILEALSNQYFPHQNNVPYQSDMLFVYRHLRILLLTRHIPLSQVSTSLSIPKAARSINQLTQYLQHYGPIHNPHYALFGINPHAGEVGGTEEETLLKPLIQQIHSQQNASARITGPLAADGAVRGLNPETPEYDAYIAPYHDQGLIPIKLLAGHHAVNVTIGLPFLRTSVSHGTAEDIVGLGIAEPDSLIATMELTQQHLTSFSKTLKTQPV